MEWVLIVHVFAGIWADSDSVSITSIPMATQEACLNAGDRLNVLVEGTKKDIRFICVANK